MAGKGIYKELDFIPFGGLKTCTKCKESKQMHEFNKDKITLSGLRCQCKECQREPNRERYKKYPDKMRNGHLKKSYNITLDFYEGMLNEQDNVCAICLETETANKYGKTISLSVDHCHKSNKIRGLLCHRCNVMLGYSKDDPAILRQAALYLERGESDSRQ